MSSELEAAGAAVTAGLVASVIDGGKTGGAAAGSAGACRNCGATLAGEYCAACGQPAHIHRSILHMAEEFLHGILHFDTRAWRTLPILLFRPGTLTHNYIHGKRARYISPLAMFLLTVFTMFFVFAMTGGAMIGGRPADPAAAIAEAESDVAQLDDDLVAATAEVARAEAALAALAADVADTDEDRIEATSDLESARVDETEARIALQAGEAALTAARTLAASATTDRDEDKIVVENVGLQAFYDEVAEAARNGEVTVNTGFKSMDKKILAKLLNPELAVYKVQNTAYKFSFLLVPISLPFMWLLFFWKRGVTLFDHAVTVLYSLSFMSLIFVIGGLLAMWSVVAISIFSSVVSLGVPVHMYFQLKGAYGLGWFSALWRALALLVFCALALSLFLLAIIVLGLAG